MSWYNEIIGDLFEADNKYALAHCVSSDLAMSAGIAKIFNQKYGKPIELTTQQTNIGNALYISNPRDIFYLITKSKYYQKPTLSSLETSLKSMRDKAIKLGISHICMPRIGCGLDRLCWDNVKQLIIEVFTGHNIKITIYTL